MELFGIGILEVLLIVLIALIVLGPQDTVRAGRNLGRAVRRFFSSEEWRTLLQASREIRTIPEKLLEETGLDHPEDILPSEAEIRQEAGLNDLEKNMAEWNADLSAMKKGADVDQPGQIPPPDKEIPRPASSPGTGARQAGLDELERDLSEWKADLSAWGNSPVIVPTPQASAAAAAQTATVSGQAPASTVSGQAPAPEEPASPAQEQPESEPPPQETASSPSPEQEQ
jgi:Sec-independent protein translocase protein TatA